MFQGLAQEFEAVGPCWLHRTMAARHDDSSSDSDSESIAEAQMGPWEIAQVKAHMEHDLGATAIAGRVFKPDGKNTWTRGNIQSVMDKLKKKRIGAGSARLDLVPRGRLQNKPTKKS